MAQGDLACLGGKPVRNEFLVFGAPLIGEEEVKEVVQTLRSGWIGKGPKTEAFERQFKEYIGASHAVAVSSCTAGLNLALSVLGIGPGDEVITTPMTFGATANVIVHQGATPVFADIDPSTLDIDPEEIERHITSHTRVILPVHFAGRACNMDAIRDIAQRHSLRVVGDAAHAIETCYRGKSVGLLSDLVAYSFYPTKNLTTGEGGMVVMANPDWAEEVQTKSLHGLSRDAWKRYSDSGFQPYETLFPGYKYNMTDIQASIGIHQLDRIEENWKIRLRHWKTYRAAFADVPEIQLPSDELEPGGRHALHLFIILLDIERLGVTRDRFLEMLKAENIGAGIHYTALHLHKYYREKYGFKPGDYPNAEWVGERTVSIPLSAKLSDEDVNQVIQAVKKIIRWCRQKGA